MPGDRSTAYRVLAEFVIIFLGVTLGLLADDWRQTRGDLEAERLALGELLVDLDADSVELEVLRARGQSWDRGALWVLTSPEAGIPSDTIGSRVRRLMLITYMQQVRSTYVGLVGAGRLGLIRDAALRRQIVDYYEVDQPYMRVSSPTGRTRSGKPPANTSPATSPNPHLIPLLRSGPWNRTKWSVRGPRSRPIPKPGIRLEALGTVGANWAARIDPILVRNGALQEAITTYLESHP